MIGSQHKTNHTVGTIENSSLIYKNDSTVASTSMIAKLMSDPLGNSPQYYQPNGSGDNHIQQFSGFRQRATASDYSDASSNRSQNLRNSAQKSSETNRVRQKSRNQDELSKKNDEITFAENAMIQEGIKVLFQKGKRNTGKDGSSPFKTQQQTTKPPTSKSKKTSIINEAPKTTKKKSKGKKSKKTKSKSVNRNQLLNFEEDQPTNIILPNARKLQRHSLDLDHHATLSISSSQQEQDPFNSKSKTLDFTSKTIKYSRAVQMLISLSKHHSKDEKRRCFEKWRFQSLAQRSSVQILAQTRWINEVYSNRTDSDSEISNRQREVILRKGLASIFRFKSRKLASMFSQWKYKVQFMKYMQSFLIYRKAGYDITQNREAMKQFEPPSKKTTFKSQRRGKSKDKNFEETENIDDSEEEELSRQKKLGLIQNKTVGRSSNKDYNFKNPVSDLEQLPYQMELFKQILQSPNKDFGRLMKLQSECSIQYFNDAVINDVSSSRRVSILNTNLNETHKTQQHNQLAIRSLFVIKKCLEGKLRGVFRQWRRETDRYLVGIEQKFKNQEVNLKKHFAKKVANLRVINEKALMRGLQNSFNLWKMTTLVDKKAENKKLQMYFLNNAKLEVQRSKAVLHKLYQQKQLFDEDQRRSRTPSPDHTLQSYYASQHARHHSFGSNFNSQQSFGPNQSQQSFVPYPSTNMSSSNIMQLMNPYFLRNQHALPQRLQNIVNEKSNQLEMVNQIKSLCYDMLLDILDEADKNNKPPPNSN